MTDVATSRVWLYRSRLLDRNARRLLLQKEVTHMTGRNAALEDWERDCMHWRGRVLIGKKSHWCYDWDGLPVDETTSEIEHCNCFDTVPADYVSPFYKE